MKKDLIERIPEGTDEATRRRLLAYGKRLSHMKAPNREHRLCELLERAETGSGRTPSFYDFAWGQLGLFGKSALLWELLWLALFLVITFNGRKLFGTALVIPIVSALTPFLLIVFDVDLGKVLNRSMLEIEMTTRYSISQILLFRLITHELLLLGIVFVGALGCRLVTGESLSELFVYGFTPLIYSSALLLAVIGRFTGLSVRYAGTAIAIMSAAALGILARIGRITGGGLSIFAGELFWVWKLLLVMGLLVYGAALNRMRKGVRIDGIGNSRSIENI